MAHALSLDWTHGFSSTLPNGVINLSLDDGVTKLAFVASHTLVVYTEANESNDPEKTGTQLFLQGHLNPIRSLLASDDRRVVITACAGPDAQVIVWDIEKGQPKRVINDCFGKRGSGIAGADLTPCGRWFAALEDVSFEENEKVDSKTKTKSESTSATPQRVCVWDLLDETNTGDTPVFIGTTPTESYVDRQTVIKCNPNAPGELITNGKTSVVFFVDDDETEEDEKRKDDDDDEEDEKRKDDDDDHDDDDHDHDDDHDDDDDHDHDDDETFSTVPTSSDKTHEKAHHKQATKTLRCYAPPVRARDFSVGAVGEFTRSAFVAPARPNASPGRGRCVTGTAGGDLLVWQGGGVLPGGAEAFEKRNMNPGDRRGVKIVKAHARGAVTHLGVVLGAGDGDDARDSAFLVTGGGDGNVRFFDPELRLVAWFDGLDSGGVSSVSFVAAASPSTARGTPLTASSSANAHAASPFRARDFLVATETSFVYGLKSNDFELLGSSGAVENAVLLLRGSLEPAVAFAVHPNEPVLCVCGARGRVWLWNFVTKKVSASRDLTLGGTHPGGSPTAVCFRRDGLGVLVGTKGGELKALDSNSLFETQAMRFTPDAVTRVVSSDDASCTYAAAADTAGAVSLFRLLGPIHEPRDGHDTARAFDFVGKHRTHAPETPCVGLGFHTNSDGDVELASVGAEGRVARFDVEGSTEEDGVDLVEVSDVALSGEAAGGNVRPTAMAFLASSLGGGDEGTGDGSDESTSESGEGSEKSGEGSESSDEDSEKSTDKPSPRVQILVADDHLKIRTVDCDSLTCVRVACGPDFGEHGPVTSLVPFREGKDDFAAFACDRDVVGIVALPATGDPRRAMGVVAHSGKVLQIAVAATKRLKTAENGSGDTETFVFALGGGGVGFGDSENCGCILSVWRVDKSSLRRLQTSDPSSTGSATTSSTDPERDQKKARRLASKRLAFRMAGLLEGGPRGALVNAARDAFAFAQLTAQGELASSDRAVDTRYGTVPVSSVAGIFRALGVYLTQREANDVSVEIRHCAELNKLPPPTEIDFDAFLVLFVNRRPVRDIRLTDLENAFAIMLDDEGDFLSRKSLLEMLKTSGEAVSDLELVEIARVLGGAGQNKSIKDLFPENVNAKNFARDVLGFISEG